MREQWLTTFLVVAASCAAKKAAPPPYAPKVAIAVTKDGFVPSTIRAKVGQPLTLYVTRRVEETCATALVIAGTPGKTELPLNRTATVTFVAAAPGETKFGCAMGMMESGQIVAD